MAKLRKERKVRRWLTTLSWTVPAMAYGGLLSFWQLSGNPTSPHVGTEPARAVGGAESGTVQHHGVASSSIRGQGSGADGAVWAMGSSGSQVVSIQRALRALGYFHGPETGYYGEWTTRAVQAFQTAQGLHPTGVVDEATLTALNRALKSMQTGRLLESKARNGDHGATGSTGDAGNQRTSAGPASALAAANNTGVSVNRQVSQAQTQSSASGW